MTSSNRYCPMPASALDILEPIADRFALSTAGCDFWCKRYPFRACISACLGDLQIACHPPSSVQTTASDSAIVKSP